MELDAAVDSQRIDGAAPSSVGQPSSAKDAAKQNQDSERFYCPYPGCNRSFAELWRLKVHFRAPPDIRGSGKERGHGTELTHCPKCGKTLKPGKHHVGCSGSKTSARQANKRNRAAGEAEPPDEALTTSHSSKHAKGDLELEPLVGSWPDYARSHALHPLALQPPLKQEQQEWPPALQPGIIYAANGTATPCWLPGQVNGFVPQLSAQGYVQPQFAADLQYASSAHGYAQQVPTFPSLSGYVQPGSGLGEPGQVLSLPTNGALQQMPGMSAVPTASGLPTVNPVLFSQQSHDTTLMAQGLDPQAQQAAAQGTQLVPVLAHGHPQQQQLHQQQQQQQQLLLPPPHNDSGHDVGQQLAGRAVPASTSGNATADGTGATVLTSAAAVGVPSSPFNNGQQEQQQQQSKPTTSNDSLGSAFGDVEEFTRNFGRIPSPPPLPADFHSASTGGNGMLFNFAQFGQKLPRSQSHTRLDKNLSAVGLGVDSGLESDLLYDHSDDGDLMQLLFGVPDELPTMATIHLHKWSTGDGDEQAGEDGGGGQLDGRGGRAGAVMGTGTSSAAATAALAQPSPPPHPSDEQLANGTATPPQRQQSQPEAPGDSVVPGSAGYTNGKTELSLLDGPDAHSHGSAPELYLAHGGGSKAALAQLVNGLGAQSHTGEEHHRDHLLDAETFRLLQSCD